jgi:hypothetical protein
MMYTTFRKLDLLPSSGDLSFAHSNILDIAFLDSALEWSFEPLVFRDIVLSGFAEEGHTIPLRI